MRFLFIILFFFLCNLNNTYADDRKLDTGFGFTITIPEEFAYFGRETGEEYKEFLKEQGIDFKDYNNLDLSGSGIFFVNIEQYKNSDYPDELYLRFFKERQRNYVIDKEYCDGYLEYYQNQLPTTEVYQHTCTETEAPKIKLGNALLIIHDIHYPYGNMNYSVQFYFDKDTLVGFAANCLPETCEVAENAMYEMLQSMEKTQ